MVRFDEEENPTTFPPSEEVLNPPDDDPVLPASRLVVAPDCGMKYLSRELALAKLGAMVQGTRLAGASAR